ncbi:MAG: D-alanyl-D-alanine carboxypeptidase/D-alanyl-D-alanine-endopeptidase [Phycisphaeraceae bacterium]|nr:D-alanyl-D-alanine carboxypeptidase/D-alanyl-D-alanine-endopeptidase [Phycisphaeraceae bacterium]
MFWTRWRDVAVSGLALLVAGTALGGLQSEVRGFLAKQDLRQTKVGLYFQDLETGEELARSDPDQLMMPASNMKLVTTAAALQVLGPDYLFRTELRVIDGAELEQVQSAAAAAEAAMGTASTDASMPTTTTSNKTVDNRPILVVHGGGDPAFGDPDVLEQFDKDTDWLLEVWVKAVRDAGLTGVSRLVIDDNIFDHEFVHTSWPKDQLDKWYCAQVSGLNFHENCVYLFLAPTRPGESPEVRILPQMTGLVAVNQARTGRSDTFGVGRQPGTNDFVVRGEVKNRNREPVAVTVHDPAMFFGQVLADRLRRAGIDVGVVEREEESSPLPQGRVLHAFQTTMPLVLARANKDSRNLYAEALVKRMGQQLTGTPGSWANGAAAVRMFLTENLGAGAAAAQVADGSGLSRDDRVTARMLVQILDKMYRDPERGPLFIRSLSVAGEDGTLERRRLLSEKMPALVLAKSGYIRGVTNLSGYLVIPPPAPVDAQASPTSAEANAGTQAATEPTEDVMDQVRGGRVVAFSMLFNDYQPPIQHYTVKEIQDKLLRLVAEKLVREQSPPPAKRATPQLGG